MLNRCRNFVRYQVSTKSIVKYLLLPSLALFAWQAYAAADGTNLLAGTEGDLIKTVKESGKMYLYIAELIIGAVSFIKTRNPLVFAGVVVLAVGFNIIFKIAGIV